MNTAYIEGIVILCGIYAIAVLGLSLLTGFTGLFSFGHAGFMAIGAYACAYLTMRAGFNFFVAILLSALITGLISLVIGKITLNLKGDYFIIATLGFGESIRLILDNIQIFGGARGWPGIAKFTTIPIVLLFLALTTYSVVSIIRSKHGRNFVAIREEELASQIIGIPVFKYKMLSLFVSAVLAGVAGALLAHYVGFLNPKMFQMIKSTELTIIVIFGGLGSITGSIVGAVVLTALPEVLRSLNEWRYVFYGAAVILIMIGRPKGLMGGQELTLRGMQHFFKHILTIRKREV